MAVGAGAGMVLGAVDSVVNHVPVWLGEVGTARAERGGWSQLAEFASLVLDAGWAWAATAVLVGWLVSRHPRPAARMLRGAVGGCLALLTATTAYYGVDAIFDGSAWWYEAVRYWLVGSVLLGPALGMVGALIRHPGPAGTIAALVAPVGAALQMAVLPPPPESLMAQPVRLTVWVAAASAAVLIIHIRGRREVLAPSVRPS
ncbi:hypothetical protein [Micromonospora okii]|uniref:hypothetical protein n=1 Tax=Micromonospora okii TaxID=1182970 RepID=UPI001E2F7EA2|nr:hypothetical protein [Micromonospora okii]